MNHGFGLKYANGEPSCYVPDNQLVVRMWHFLRSKPIAFAAFQFHLYGVKVPALRRRDVFFTA